MPAKTRHGRTRAAAPVRPTVDEQREAGKSLRQKCPRGSHAIWKPPANRPDPLRLLEQSNKGRIAGLIPIRYGRMVRTPFTFYRGAALNMAADLAATPATGLRVQACGDCHLLNFGALCHARATARVRHQRSGRDAARALGMGRQAPRRELRACVPQQRLQRTVTRAMRCWPASAPTGNAWRNTATCRCSRSGTRASTSRRRSAAVKDKEASQRAHKRIAATRARSVLEHDFPKLAAGAGHAPTIKDNPPLIYHLSGKERERPGRARPRRLRRLPGIAARKIGACSSTVTRSRTSRSRSSASAASGPSARSCS